MSPEFSGLERRLDELRARVGRLEKLARRDRADFDGSADLRDVAERNLEVAAQCCLDMANRIISESGARKPTDYRASITALAEIGVLPAEFARRLAPLAGFRNILVHEYAEIDWDLVYRNLQRVEDLREFARHVARWMEEKSDR